jgi:hypothetical protein
MQAGLLRPTICAICEEDHYEQLGLCVRCEQPRFVAILLFLLSGLVALALLRFLYKYRHIVIAMQVGANLKILVSFTLSGECGRV